MFNALGIAIEFLLKTLSICFDGRTPYNSYGVFTSNAECYTDILGRDYRGYKSLTATGKQCQSWTDQEPHQHNRTEARYPGTGLGEHNYCRNPDNEPRGAWCYTTDSESRWEYCYLGEQNNYCSSNFGMIQ